MTFKRKKKLSVQARLYGSVKSIFLVGDVVQSIESVLRFFLEQCKRRRNSYRLSGYFAFYASLCFVRVVVYFISLAKIDKSFNSALGETCTVASSEGATYADILKTVRHRPGSIMCEEDKSEVFGAISRAQAQHFINLYWFLGIEASICLACGLMLGFLFNYFSQLPMSAFQEGRKGCCHRIMLSMGGFCKHGLWIMNFLTLLRLTYCIAAALMIYGSGTYGSDISATYACAMFDYDCTYIKYMNCRYHATRTQGDTMACLDLQTRMMFSGHVDVRMLPAGTENCVHHQVSMLDGNNADAPQFEMVEKEAYLAILPSAEKEAAAAKCVDSKVFCFRLSKAACDKLEADARCAIPHNIICSNTLNTNRTTPPMSFQHITSPDRWKLKKQYCEYMPEDESAYFTDENACFDLEQTTLYQQNVMIFVSEVTCFFTLLVVGMLTKKFVEPETIFFSPPRSEHRCWTLVRAIGPS